MAKRNGDQPKLPERGAALRDRRFLLSFDVDCGELIPGHHFVARGLSDVGKLTQSDWEPDASTEPVQAFAFEYELVPGVPPGEDASGFFQYLVGIAYDCDVDLPWEPADGGAIAPFEGGAATHGARGDWPLPAGARTLTFALYGIDASGHPREQPAGELLVDLGKGTARWTAT